MRARWKRSPSGRKRDGKELAGRHGRERGREWEVEDDTMRVRTCCLEQQGKRAAMWSSESARRERACSWTRGRTDEKKSLPIMRYIFIIYHFYIVDVNTLLYRLRQTYEL
jgi:hypothetical protein